MNIFYGLKNEVTMQFAHTSTNVVDDRLIRLSQSRGDYYFLFLPPSPPKKNITRNARTIKTTETVACAHQLHFTEYN